MKKNIALLVYDGVDGLHVTNITDVFAFANLELIRQGFSLNNFYSLRTIAHKEGQVITIADSKLMIDETCFVSQAWHAIFIPGGDYESALANFELLTWLKLVASKAHFLAGICEGSFLLAEAGLLNFRNATTRSVLCDQLSIAYPDVNVQMGRLVVEDKGIYTSSGRASCLDLALKLIEQDWGTDFALYVSRYLSIFQTNKHALVIQKFSKNSSLDVDKSLSLLLEWIASHITQEIQVDDLAYQVSMSPRNFTRWFSAKMGVSPAKYIETIRLEKAKLLLEADNVSLESVAEQTGFDSLQKLRRAFARNLNINPKDYRKILNKANVQKFALIGLNPIEDYFDDECFKSSNTSDSSQYNQENELPFRSIYNLAINGILVIRIVDRRIVVGNPAICRMLQYSKKEITKLEINSLHPYDQLKAINEIYDSLIRSEISAARNVAMLRKNGNVFYVDITASVLLIKFERCLIIHLYDVTARRKAEQELLDIHQRLSLAIRSANVGLWDYNLLTKETYYSWEWKAQLGYLDEEIGNHFDEWLTRLHPEDRDATLSYLSNFLEKPKGDYSIEFRLRHKDNSYRWILANASIICDENHKPVRMLGSHIDITENKQQQLVFKTLFEQSPLGVAQIDSNNGRFLKVNQKYCDLVGYSEQELLSKTFLEISHSEELAENLIRLEKLRSEEIKSYKLIKRLIHKNGGLIWIELSVSALWVPGAVYKTHMAVIQDITAQIHFQEQLKKSEKNLRAFITDAPVAMAMLDSDMNYVAVSSEWLKNYSLSQENIIGCSHCDIFPEIAAQWKAIHLRGMSGEIIRCDEDVFLRNDGSSQWLKWVVQPWYQSNEAIGGIIIASEDISERIRSHRQLASFQKMIELAGDPFYLADLEDGFRMIHANAAAIRHFGVNPATLYSWRLPDWDPNFKDNDIPKLVERILESNSLAIQSHHRIQGGRIVPVEISINHFSDELGKRFAFGWFKDISERLKTENELQQRENKYRSLFEAMGEGVALHELRFDDEQPIDYVILDINPAYESILELKRDAVIGHLGSEVYGTDTAPYLDIFAQVAINGNATRFEVNFEPMGKRFSIAVFSPGQNLFATVFEDITQRTIYEQTLKQAVDQAANFQSALDHIPAYVYMKDLNNHYFYANQHTLKLFDCLPTELPEVDDSRFFPPEVVQRIRSMDRQVLAGETIQAEMDFSDDDGVRHVYWDIKTPLKTNDNDNNIFGLLGISTDITERKQTEEALRLAASVFENTHDGILITNQYAVILDVNQVFCEITGFSREEALGQTPRMLQSGLQSSGFYDQLWKQLIETGVWRGEILNRKKDGSTYCEWLTISAVRDKSGQTTNYIGTFADVSILKQRELELQRVAYYDSLTGIPNRVMLSDRMHQAIAHSKRQHCQFAVAYLDLDGFKPVNDQFGHDTGDELLKAMVQRIKNALREGDTLARLGGDEFLILLINIPEQAECFNLINRILTVVNKPQPLNGNNLVTISASIGVTLFPHDNVDPDTLIRHADQAMYQAKLAGRNRFHIYDPTSDQQVQARQLALEEIAQALVNNEFRLYYQPKIDLETQRTIGVEALIRWQHPAKGLLPPQHFLPVIENTELEITVGQWVIDTALRQLHEWHLSGLSLQISINISGDHLQRPDFVQTIQASLKKYPELPVGFLQIEVLETVALKDFDSVTKTLLACQQFGISFALDDFGTGYSSLVYLRNLPVEIIKIDQTFIRDMLVDEGDRAIVEGILALTETFKRKSVAEGIETAEHFRELKELGCHYGQGYHIAHPMPANDFFSWYFSKKELDGL